MVSLVPRANKKILNLNIHATTLTDLKTWKEAYEPILTFQMNNNESRKIPGVSYDSYSFLGSHTRI